MSTLTDNSSPGPDIGAPSPREVGSRLFVVGCPRSGTTLLQSFLAAHPAVLAFPETAVFARLLFVPSRVATATTDVAARIAAAHARARALLDAMERPDLGPLLDPAVSIVEFGRSFVGVLDRLTLDQGKHSWAEKTPKHLAFVSEIRGLVPGARFLNILRDGRQNVASLYEAALKHPNVWWPAGSSGDLEQAIERWNSSVRHARALRGVPDVLLIRYERLVSDTEAVLREICTFAGLAFRSEMIERRTEAARAVVTAPEHWKADVLQGLRPAPDDKFDRLFNAEQKAYIDARLEQIDF
jgi:hypothetical protein